MEKETLILSIVAGVAASVMMLWLVSTGNHITPNTQWDSMQDEFARLQQSEKAYQFRIKELSAALNVNEDSCVFELCRDYGNEQKCIVLPLKGVECTRMESYCTRDADYNGISKRNAINASCRLGGTREGKLCTCVI